MILLVAALGLHTWRADSLTMAHPQWDLDRGTGINSAYLPIVNHNHPLKTLFGIQTFALIPSGGLNEIAQSGSTWTRRNGILWSSVEAVEGVLDWSAAADLELELADASEQGLEVILIVRGTPSWAQDPATQGFSCGPIAADKLAAFQTFMLEMVGRYRAPPFNVRYFEIWNEPDVDPGLVTNPNSGFGCWGDVNDPFYGGGRYADMLASIYGPVKSAFPNVQILLGGLLLDCDPALMGACTNPHGSAPSKFLEGVLRRNGLNDGADHFDGISFHAYDFYGGTLGEYGNSNWGSTWNSTGPVSLAKASFIRELLDQFGVPEKYLINSESALLCDVCMSDPVFEQTKAIYVAQNFASASDAGFKANIWYTALGWRNSDLLNTDLSPKPAYNALVVSRQQLRSSESLGAVDSGDVADPGGIQGYKLDRKDRQIWIMWSSDGDAHEVTLLPGQPFAAYDLFGTSLGVTQTITVTSSPVYLEWLP